MPPDVCNEYFIRYINQRSLLINDKCLERLSIFINFAECCHAGRIAMLRTGNELYISISVLREKKHYHFAIFLRCKDNYFITFPLY